MPFAAGGTLTTQQVYDVAEFGAAFPQRKNPICFSTTKLALAAYVSTLLTPDSPFDCYL